MRGRGDPPGGGRPRTLHGGRPDVGDLPLDEDVRRELDFHVEMRARELMTEGWSEDAAREEARRLLGDRDDVEVAMRRETESKDRAVRRERVLEGLWQDVRFALRTFRKDPGFTAVAVLTLALGIGANTAIFSVVDGVLLRPLPFPEPEDLVWVAEEARGGGAMTVAWPNARDWARESTVLDAVAAHQGYNVTVLGGERPLTTMLAPVSVDFWRVFPVTPVHGRLTTEEDHQAGAPSYAVIREDFWRTEFGGRPLEELRVEIGGRLFPVVGVVPDDFDYPRGARIWSPVESASPGESRSAHNYQVVARLGEGRTVAQADQELDAITERIMEGETGDPTYLAVGAVVVPLHERVTGDARLPLLLLLGAAVAVLLVACTNLASTLLARGESRRGELSVRTAMGATRGRVLRQLVTEGTLLASLGAGAGVLLAWGLLDVLAAGSADTIPRLDEVGIDGRILLFTAAVTVATALAFSLLPALRLTGGGLAATLRESRDAGGRGRTWKLLVGTEVALALFLLVGSGLLLRSLGEILSRDRGFDASDVMTATVGLSGTKYPTNQERADWYAALVDDLESRPGVASAGLVSTVPLAGFFPNGRLELDGDLSKHADAGYAAVDGGYFGAMDIPLLQGRIFDRRDGPDAPHVAMVSRSFAETYWPGEDPVGRQVTGGGMDEFWEPRPFATVVGVVGDVVYRDLTREPGPTVYFPVSQRNARVAGAVNVVVEMASGGAEGAVPILRDAITGRDPDVPLRFQAMDDRVAGSVAARRFVLAVLGGFGGVALLLAGVGIYGVVSYTVARRRREMGIRLALGAPRARVQGMVVREALAMVAGGLLVGVVASLWLTSFFEELLFGVAPRDPVTMAAVPVLLLAVALLASWLPAHGTTRIDPSEAMRTE